MLRFLSCSPSGLAIGDVPDKQPIGIVLTVLGVVVLDFCADATEGPIRAYLLDVVDSEEQDMALNIHAFSAGTWLGHVLAAVSSSDDRVLAELIFPGLTAVFFILSPCRFLTSTEAHSAAVLDEIPQQRIEKLLSEYEIQMQSAFTQWHKATSCWLAL